MRKNSADPRLIVGELLRTLNAIHIDLPDQCAAVERIHALVSRSPQKPAQIIVVEADHPLGKTRILDIISGNIQSTYARKLGGTTFRVDCTSGIDARGLGTLLCRRLEVAPIGLSNVSICSEYICKKLEQRRPALLAIDNAHLLMSDGNPNVPALDILGAILAAGTVPVVLSGRVGTVSVATHLVGMVGQIMEPLKLSALPYAKATDLDRISDFLLIISADLAPILSQINLRMMLNTEEMAKRFWAASWGFPGDMKLLILESLLTIINLRATTLHSIDYVVKREDFANAWSLLIAWRSPLKFNPFQRDAAPTLGEVRDARSQLVSPPPKSGVQLPRAPKGKGALIWR